MAEPLLPGDPRQLGSFYLDGRLGAGGQGVVYEGYGPGGERVAVKALHGVSDRDREMLRKETWAWQRVAAFCTAKVLHVDLDGPIPFVVSEHVAGPTLRQAVEQGGPYGPEELRRLAIGVATALVGIHRAGVVHRDLKPENILLGPDGPRVIDFGIARVEELPTTTGQVKGTLRYMPPERYRGEHGDAKVDVWGWGAVVLFAATGRHAFDGETAPLVARQVAEHDPDTSMLDEPLRSLVTAALSKDPSGRPKSEELLLGLIGGADLAEATREAAAGHEPTVVQPSRAELAEAVFSSLDVRAQEAVPGMFLRLVAPGERAEDTLRSARRAEFADGRTDERIVERVLHDFTRAGILVWEGESVTLASAALIRAWPRLREWVAAERGGLEVHHGLVVAARLWDGHGRKNSDLHQGTALQRALAWAATGRRHLTLNLVERAFLDAAAALARRRGRLRAALSTVLVALLVIAVGAATVAFDQRQTVIGQRDRAMSVQVAGLAQSLRRTDPKLARRLAVAAARLGGTTESHSALLALRHQREEDAFELPGLQVTSGDLDDAGRTLVVADGTRVEFWNVETHARTGVYHAPAEVGHVSLSDDGRTAAVSTSDGYVRLLDAAGARLRDAHTYPIMRKGVPRAALSPMGTYLLIDQWNPDRWGDRVEIWDTSTARKVTTLDDIEYPLLNITFSPDEKVISLPGRKDGEFTWTDPREHKRRSAVPTFGPDVRGPVAFSPDGQLAAVRVKGGKIRVARIAGGRYTTELRGGDDLSPFPLRFSHDGRHLAQGGVVWETTGIRRDPVMRYPTTRSECHPDYGFPFTADGSAMRCLGDDGVVRSLGVGHLTKAPAVAEGAHYSEGAVSGDRSTIAIHGNGTVEIWSTAERTRRSTVTSGAGGATLQSLEEVRLSHDGRLLAAVVNLSQVGIWDTAGGRFRGGLPVLDPDQEDASVRDLAFSPDGRSLAVLARTLEGASTLTFWDLTAMRRIGELRAGAGPIDVRASVLFHRDGRSLVATPSFGLVEFPSGRILTKATAGLEVDTISDDGGTLYGFPHGSRPYLQMWDARTLRPLGRALRTGPVPVWTSQLTAASPNGRLFATVHQSSTNHQIRIWDRRTRRQLGISLTGPLEEVVAITFVPDGSAVVSVDEQGRFFTHVVAPEQLIQELCRRSGPLTEREWRAHIPDVPYRKTC